ncbi:hypothetical protein [Paenibacillus sp. 32O-W]|uniref:hypothetical protein n=1 Tax=Paenibacillus sp. 32O-W TaxID=1695218 RepID=UPI001C92E51A|nr:hypothetical protein [Paenibacillus sp. 32O-W]
MSSAMTSHTSMIFHLAIEANIVKRITFKSKNDLAVEMIEVFPANHDERVYVLMDSWYTSEKVVNDCNCKGFHDIATIKTNRLI